MTPVVVDVEGLRMRYGRTDVLDGVSLQVRQGEVLALLGPNGAGKTTTIEILEGFRLASAGRAEVLGTDPARGGEAWRARVGVVLQSWRDHGKWRVRELLAHQASYYPGRPWDADELIAAVGLTGHAGKKIRTLSGGQRRRLDVAIGIVGRPEVLFLDEPTAGFDPQARREFHDLVGGLDTTVLLTTHDLDEAEKLADRIAVLDRGRIIADGTPYEPAGQIAGADRVRWKRGGQRFTESTPDSTAFIRELFRQYGDSISEVEVHRACAADARRPVVHARRGVRGHGVHAGHARAAEHPGHERLRRHGLHEPALSGGAWPMLALVVVVGMAATLPLGAILGSVFADSRSQGLIQLLMIAVIAISGIFYPITALPVWVQVVAQVFPVYWLGLGMRSALLPGDAVSVEIGESWRHVEMTGVLGAWVVFGLVVAPIVLRGMARGESGSGVAARRERVLQRIG
ncbi:ABC-type multidrug transport system, ATPase component [Nonomuraea jiangxiensis]|uniref:ABC-type multidrug transport system, ATPase component n=2 Tax=Nonomuraea jiangxiensis TaxID=633440 RepID=A0A1G9B279_9ACTN|nr:ABC-type multidrug transport system, ATPase component [Nonomuraea jiangxiensis]